ncbi:MAG: hypothetical protein ACM3IJ_04110 [Candidatus Levyibacteriota bacterium]
MKTKYIFTVLILIAAVVFLPNISYSQTVTPTSKTATSSATTSPLNEDEMKNVKKIIDLVASNSASQKSAEKRGVLGKVTVASSTTLTLEVLNGENRVIDIDDITKFSDPDSKTFGISDIKSGDQLGVIGVLNKVSGHILGRDVTKVSIPTYFEGAVLDLDKKNYTFNAVDENGNKKLINIETSTKISSFNKDDGQLKSGFSKITSGERVYVAGFPDPKIKDQINADRIIHFPDLAISLKMKNYVDFQDTIATPSATPTR